MATVPWSLRAGLAWRLDYVPPTMIGYGFVPDVPPAPDEVAVLRAANARLREVIEAKDTEIGVLCSVVEAFQAQREELRAQVADLRAPAVRRGGVPVALAVPVPRNAPARRSATCSASPSLPARSPAWPL